MIQPEKVEIVTSPCTRQPQLRFIVVKNCLDHNIIRSIINTYYRGRQTRAHSISENPELYGYLEHEVDSSLNYTM
jgi:hypothetical protein